MIVPDTTLKFELHFDTLVLLGMTRLATFMADYVNLWTCFFDALISAWACLRLTFLAARASVRSNNSTEKS